MPGHLEAALSRWCAWPLLGQNLIPSREGLCSFMPSQYKVLHVSLLTLQTSFMVSDLNNNPQHTPPLTKVVFGAPLSGWGSQSCKRFSDTTKSHDTPPASTQMFVHHLPRRQLLAFWNLLPFIPDRTRITSPTSLVTEGLNVRMIQMWQGTSHTKSGTKEESGKCLLSWNLWAQIKLLRGKNRLGSSSQKTRVAH